MLLLICSHPVSAIIDSIPKRYLGLQANYGFIIPHSAAIRDISHTNPYGFELSFNRLHDSYNNWKVFNAYWNSGIQAGYFNYQYPDVIGSAFLLTVYAEPIVACTGRFQFAIRTGAGISYHTKKYDAIENPVNFFFGTSFNFPLYVDLRLKFRTGENALITLSGCYNHISNGGFKQPNKGMNFPTLAAGAEYFFRKIPVLTHNLRSDASIPKPGFSIILQFLGTGRILEKTDQFPEKRVFAWGIHGRAVAPVKGLYSLNAGAEIIFDGYIKGMVERDGSGLDYTRFALTAGQDFRFGRVNFTQYFGFYVYSPYNARNSVYQKYELSYRIHKNMTAGVFLKAHLQVAELSGITLNWVKEWKRRRG